MVAEITLNLTTIVLALAALALIVYIVRHIR